jgi:hypothetical protein
MTKLDLVFGTDQGPETIRFRKIAVSDGRHYTQAVLYRGNPSDPASAAKVIASGQTRLGKQDAAENRYSFFAGARIAFERMLERVPQDADSAAELRRMVQVQLSLSETTEEGKQAFKRLKQIERKWLALKEAEAAIANAAELRAYYAGLNKNGDATALVPRRQPEPPEPVLEYEGEILPIVYGQHPQSVDRAIDEIRQRVQTAYGSRPTVKLPEDYPIREAEAASDLQAVIDDLKRLSGFDRGFDPASGDDSSVVEVVRMNDDGTTSHVKSFDLRQGMTIDDVIREALR